MATHGGYRLARAPKQITALEVIRAIDGPIVLGELFHGGSLLRSLGSLHGLKKPLKRIHDRILRLLDSVSIRRYAGRYRGRPA